MKVNMTPNPLDVVTIHASQGDTEARQWEFELHNNGEKIDSSSISDQLVFKAYEGGTEQILPENTSTPTTSPFKGDIKYPQGLLSDQEFLYRESPTESDGLAKITDIKGNTLVWNQQMDSSRYNTGTYSGVAVTKSTDETYLIANGTATANAYIRLFNVTSFPTISGHKYCCVVPTDSNVAYYDNSSPRQYSQQFSSFMFTSNGNPIRPYARIDSGVASTNRRISFMMFDLTQMGLDITDPSDFTSLFSLPYYDYNQGTLLSFMGNGIKTVGFNQWDEEWELGSIDANGENTPSTVEIRSKNYIPVILGETYYIKQTGVQVFHFYDGNLKYLGNQYIGESRLLNIPSGTEYIRFRCANTYGTSYKNDICLNISDSSRNGEYEPYTSSTLSLPISTYFPTGMKSAGSVYDELTPMKAITRIGAVNLGSLTWYYSGGLFLARINDGAYTGSSVGSANGICSLYEAKAVIATSLADKQMTLGTAYAFANMGNIVVKDSSYTSSSDFKTAMDGVYLYYELATPTETSFTTASLVTENAEIPLSNEDGVLVGKCTEQLSAEPGFHDAKIKLSDSDGECYSNKIQLHVERKPS